MDTFKEWLSNKEEIINESMDRQDIYHCPVCGEEREWSCRCSRADSGCKNKHEWHYCPIHREKINLGRSDHSKAECTCGR